jgi:hypothetical protein
MDTTTSSMETKHTESFHELCPIKSKGNIFMFDYLGMRMHSDDTALLPDGWGWKKELNGEISIFGVVTTKRIAFVDQNGVLQLDESNLKVDSQRIFCEYGKSGYCEYGRICEKSIEPKTVATVDYHDIKNLDVNSLCQDGTHFITFDVDAKKLEAPKVTRKRSRSQQPFPKQEGYMECHAIGQVLRLGQSSLSRCEHGSFKSAVKCYKRRRLNESEKCDKMGDTKQMTDVEKHCLQVEENVMFDGTTYPDYCPHLSNGNVLIWKERPTKRDTPTVEDCGYCNLCNL